MVNANAELQRAFMKRGGTDEKDFGRIATHKKEIHSRRNDVLSRYIRSQYGITENAKDILPPSLSAINIAGRTANNVVDAESMLQLLPDMELAKSVLVSSVLSPNDMMSAKLGYRTTNTELGEVAPHLLKVVTEYFENTHKINKRLPKMLDDILFTRGAYPIAVIPEAAIDDIINGTGRVATESLSGYIDTATGLPRGTGILGSGDDPSFRWSFGLESVGGASAIDPQIYVPSKEEGKAATALPVIVTDNVSLLKLPQVHQRMVNDRLRDVHGMRSVALESAVTGDGKKKVERLSDREVDDMLSAAGRRQYSYQPVVSVKSLRDLEKPTRGHPLTLNLPTEAVVPVHVPSAPEQHIGYFIVTDQYGNPIKADLTKDYFTDITANASGLKDMSSMLLAQTKRSTEGAPDAKDFRLIEDMQISFNQIVEKNIRNRLSNGIYGDNVEVSDMEIINRIMLARCCARKQTQLIYIPIQLMTYMAIDYNDFGVGKSLLEATKILGALRSLMLFSNTMAAVKNSITHTDLNIQLDPKDQDPLGTVNYLQHVYARTRGTSFPVGVSSPTDLIHYLLNAGVRTNISGHPGMPETKADIEQRQTNYTKVDTELDEMLKKRHLQSVYVPPETVDLSMNVDFAQSVISSNLLLAKRAMLIQQTFCEQLSDYHRKFIMNSQPLMDELRKIVEENKDKIPALQNPKYDIDDIVVYFLGTLECFLPEPDISRMEVQKTNFDAYAEFVDSALDYFISSDQFNSSIFGQLSETVDTTKAVLKASIMRDYMATNNILPEINKLFVGQDDDDIGSDLLTKHKQYMDSLGKSLIPFMKESAQTVKKNDKVINKIKEEMGVDDLDQTSGGGGEGGDAGGAGDGGGGDEFGGGADDDFGLGGDENLNPGDAGGGGEGTAAGGEGGETKEEEPAKEEETKEEPEETPKDDEEPK